MNRIIHETEAKLVEIVGDQQLQFDPLEGY
jgi:hypothetical protein